MTSDAAMKAVYLKSLASQPRKATETIDANGDSATLTKTTERRVKTLADLIAVCEIDQSEWEVERWVCNKWEVGGFPRATRQAGADLRDWVRPHGEIGIHPLYQVKAWLKRKHHIIAAKAEIEALRKKAEGYAPKYPAILKRSLKESGNLGEFAIVDQHHGALIWGKETGGADWDLKKSSAAWRDAFATLGQRTSHLKLDEAILVLGNDQQNADNRLGTTERGTPQQMDGRHQKVFEISRDCSIWAVEFLMARAAKVSVLLIPGNHDPLTTWSLGYTLHAWFRNAKQVAVDIAPTGRKYRQHGRVMLMWEHGNHGKLEEYPGTMASEQPRMWGETAWREAHTGDKHHRRLLELRGATVRILPSLRPPCAWSAENHFIGSIRAAEAYIWNADEGLISTASYSILGDQNGQR
jgi:hypothetical protein